MTTVENLIVLYLQQKNYLIKFFIGLIIMSSDYEHYLNLSKEDLIKIIKKKDNEINGIQQSLKETRELKKKYYNYNFFHMQEISRLDKVIGGLKGLR